MAKVQTTINFPARKTRFGSNPASPAITKKISDTPVDKKIEKLSIRTSSATKRHSPQDENVAASSPRPTRVSRNLFNNTDVSPPKQKKSTAVYDPESDDDFELTVRKVQSPWERAKLLLNASFVDEFVHRDNELRDIHSYLDQHLKQKKATGLYISGAPGTGKTLCVSHVLKTLKRKYGFNLVTVNCMDCRVPTTIYSKIVGSYGLTPCKTPKANLELIEDKIATPTSKSKKPTESSFSIVLLDEIDKLESKSQDVLYTLFDLPRLEQSRLILIGIANTLDLTVRTLSRYKALSLSDIKEIHFHPYTQDQVRGIIESRLRQVNETENEIFDKFAMEICARRVATHSGDVRKALQVCRRAIELAESEAAGDAAKPMVGNKTGLAVTSDDGCNPGSPRKTNSGRVRVTRQHVLKVLSDVYGSQLSKTVDKKTVLPTQQQLILCALLVSGRQSKRGGDIELSKCHETFSRICSKKSICFDVGNRSEFIAMCHLLESKGFVAVKTVKNCLKLSLTVDTNDVEEMMTDKAMFNSILADKSAQF